jgi:hypothetical protein
MDAPVDGEPPQEDDRDIASRQTFCLFSRKILASYSVGGDRIIAEDPRLPLSDGHIGASQVPAIELAGPLLQPVVQRRLSAVERRPVMPGTESLDHPVAM